MENIYPETVIDHYWNSQNRGRLKNADFWAKEENFFCGDKMTIYIKMAGRRIKQISFVSKGCVISQASASVLAEYSKNHTKKEIQKMSVKKIIALLGISPGPNRIRCAELPLAALKKAFAV